MISHLYGSHYFLATEFAPRSQRIDLLGVPPSSARCCLGARWRGLTRRTHTAPTIPPRGSATQPGPQHTCSPQVCRPASAASPRKAVYYGASPHRRHHRRVRNRVPRRRRRTIGAGFGKHCMRPQWRTQRGHLAPRGACLVARGPSRGQHARAARRRGHAAAVVVVGPVLTSGYSGMVALRCLLVALGSGGASALFSPQPCTLEHSEARLYLCTRARRVQRDRRWWWRRWGVLGCAPR